MFIFSDPFVFSRFRMIDNEAAAQKFIADFVAKRQPDFAKIVADRAAKADQYLSFGKTLGSTTLLGKIIILFGPPAGMEVATTQHQGHAQMTSEAMQGAGGEATGLNVADAAQAVQAGGMSSTSTNTYTVTYRAKSVPTLDKDLIVVVEAPLAGGRQQIRDSKSAAEVNDLFERVEAASIVPAPSH